MTLRNPPKLSFRITYVNAKGQINPMRLLYKRSKAFVDYFFKHFINEDTLCCLCANTGIVETHPKNPRGDKQYHYKGFCICPNGQVLRSQQEKTK